MSNKEIINELESSVNINQSIEQEVVKTAKEERNMRLKKMSENLKKDIEKLEKEPAFRRRNVQLTNVPPASESSVSKFTLTEDDEKNVVIKPNNSFLHDNVD